MDLITTVGASDANSFCTVSEADTYLAAHTIVDTSAWSALTTAQKAERLYQAALIMSQHYMWFHYPVYEKQALPFPRWYLDSDGDEQYVGGGSSASIPEPIKQAQALIALNVVHRGALSLTSVSQGVAKPPVKKLSLFGSLSVEVQAGDLSPSAAGMLANIIQTENWMIESLLGPYKGTVLFSFIDSDNDPGREDEITS